MNAEVYGPRTPAWRALRKHAERLSDTTITQLFERNQARFEAMSCEALGILLDFSRQKMDEDVLQSLLDLAKQTRVGEWIERMFAGERINTTENRAALHVALRRPANQPLLLDGKDIMPLVEAERQKMYAFADALQAGELKGVSGEPITDVVNIGIGGSDLGIVVVLEALAEYRLEGVDFHCVSNIDGVKLAHVLRKADPETTLFVICSKSFTTLETLTNAKMAREWLVEAGGEQAVAAQCIAVSTNHAAMDEFGIAPDKRLAMWDWVGGRFSLWSAVGVTIAMAVGKENFRELLHGAHMMDEHFRHELFEINLPVLLALIGLWNRNFLDCASHAVLPYDDHLARFPAFLQQLEMESNGKSVRRNGAPVECATCPVVWGEPGSNAQHSFFQSLHQGTERVSLDFLLPLHSSIGQQDNQTLVAANCLAQVWALAVGDPGDLSSGLHQQYEGTRGSTLLLFPGLSPNSVGALFVLYEHKVFVQGMLWDVNSFDQYGVELGKKLASKLLGSPSASEYPHVIAGAMSRLKTPRY